MAEVYKVQVAIGATNGISPVLAMIAKDFKVGGTSWEPMDRKAD
jgi:hypothetical protein